MSPIEKKRKLVEIQRVKTAKLEMELKIEERLLEIERLKENMANQDERVAELEAELGISTDE